tara:strand:+ start:15 stop:179 length:165 start_codon:yes stop_codon:yes gene_type:complete
MNIIKVPLSPFMSDNETLFPSVEIREKSFAFSPKLQIGDVIAMEIFKNIRSYSQ